ncbi:MAG: DNA replication/repair protein RecF [Anaerolineales bacterium]
MTLTQAGRMGSRPWTYATIAAAMLLKHLSLTNFRNFIRLETDIPDGATILVGANAQGKTSLLEAIFYLTGASPFYATSDRQLINFLSLEDDQPFARLVAEVEAHSRMQRVEIRLSIERTASNTHDRLHKDVLINGLKRRVRDLAHTFNAVMFLPRDLEIIEGSPGNRRRFLDSSLSQADPMYSDALAEYGKVLTQRNALLKQLQERQTSNGELEFWDEQLCEHGAALIRGRALALGELSRDAAHIHSDLSQGKETLQLDYQPAYDPAAPADGQLGLPLNGTVDRTGISREQIRSGMQTALRAQRREEITRGMTLIGPHRDDLRLLANGIDLRMYGSRGQNRTAMLSVKLAEVGWLMERTGDWPILLLDEVLAELDVQRREDLLARIGEVRQALLTASDLSMFSDEFRQQASIWRIESGTVHNAEPGAGA